MGNQLSDLGITSAGTLSREEMEIICDMFGGLKSTIRDGEKVISQKELTRFMTATLPTVAPSAPIIFEVFKSGRTANDASISYKGFCRMFQALSCVGKKDEDECSLASIIFRHFARKEGDRISIDRVRALGGLLRGTKLSESQATKWLKQNNAQYPKKGFSREEFGKFFDSCVPREGFGRRVSSVPLIQTNPIQRKVMSQTIVSPIAVFEPENIFMKHANNGKVSSLTAVLDEDCLLPTRFADVAMAVYGDESTMTYEQYRDLRLSVEDASFARRVFDFFDGDHDGVWTLDECIKSGSMLHINSWRNSKTQWMDVANECAVLLHSHGVSVDWFAANLFLME